MMTPLEYRRTIEAIAETMMTPLEYRRTIEAIAETQRLIAKEERYQPHLQKSEYLSTLYGHLARLSAMLVTGGRGMTFRPGTRVRLTHDIAPYPLGLFKAGTRGTVVWVNEDAPATEPVMGVYLDDHHPNLNDWRNELQVYRAADNVSEVTPEVFVEAVPERSRLSIRMPLKD